MARLLLFCVLAAGLVGCASQREVGLAELTGDEVRVQVAATEKRPEGLASHWQVIEGSFAPTEPASPVRRARPRPAAPVRAAPAPVKLRRPLPAPRRRAARPARVEGRKTGKTAAQLAREHFLDFPTRIEATRITLYCPAQYAAEVRMRGETVDRSQPARQRAVGGARLVLRELTLEADRITLRVRDPAEQDLQITARGGVRFVSKVRDNVHREDGLRSLLITNDRTVPLR